MEVVEGGVKTYAERDERYIYKIHKSVAYKTRTQHNTIIANTIPFQFEKNGNKIKPNHPRIAHLLVTCDVLLMLLMWFYSGFIEWLDRWLRLCVMCGKNLLVILNDKVLVHKRWYISVEYKTKLPSSAPKKTTHCRTNRFEKFQNNRYERDGDFLVYVYRVCVYIWVCVCLLWGSKTVSICTQCSCVCCVYVSVWWVT